ncbi:DUF2726 domain-containing protein [Sphingomonas arenae]|uniref:DUF2726 domain-containing protein n=1 Tax=Sphingomonas arenae TaxID=2812555 RepID=UPI00196830B1|nr:DUF2726 domain-containing protein [Sphingomonas arenae]
MPPEILALIDKPLSLAAVLFVGALFGMTIEQIVSKQRREAWKARKKARGEWVERGRRGPRPGFTPRHDPLPTSSRMPDAADQLRTVMGAEFRAKRLLNRGEGRVFAALEPIVRELAPGWHVMAQVSLGEVLDADSTEAFNTINAKRVDFLLVDAEMKPRHAIEYQGQGHHQGTAAARDAVKKEALRRAGIGYAEVFADDTPAELRMAVAKIIGVAGQSGPFGRAAGRAAGVPQG